MNQTFTCSGCDRTSSVRIRMNEDLWSVYVKVITKHQNLKPRCVAGVDKIQVHSQLGIVKAALTKKGAR